MRVRELISALKHFDENDHVMCSKLYDNGDHGKKRLVVSVQRSQEGGFYSVELLASGDYDKKL